MDKTQFLTSVKQKLNWKFSTAYITKIAILTTISFLLYAFGKFSIPIAFPSFLDIQFSELPALLAGFSMGPVSGCMIIVLKCLFKLPMSSTGYVGELTDIIIGIAFVLPASLIYRHKKDRKHAFLGLFVGSIVVVAVSVLINRFISIPFFVEFFFKGNWNVLLGIVKPIYPTVTIDNFYAWYLGVGIVPFNLLRCLIVSTLTFLVYKKLSKILHWDGSNLGSHKLSGKYESYVVDDTYELAEKIADTLEGNEKIILEGDLGAGKTTFTKGLAKALGIEDEITSPTFTIMNIYEGGKFKLNHLDMYRIENEEDTYELGIEEALEDGVSVIEWNKLECLTGRIINVKIETVGENERKIIVDDSKDTVHKHQNINVSGKDKK